MANKDYMIDDESGKVFRKGEHIGNVEENGDVKLLPDKKQYKAALTRFLNEKRDEEEAGEVEDKSPAADPAARPLTKEEQAEQDLRGISKEGLEDAKKARDSYLDDKAFAEKQGIEPPPKKNPQFGDKSPDYVEWLRRHRPDKYRKVYGFKKRGKVPIFKRNPETGIDEVEGYRDTDLCARKTHLSEKVEHDTSLSEDMSWEA